MNEGSDRARCNDFEPAASKKCAAPAGRRERPQAKSFTQLVCFPYEFASTGLVPVEASTTQLDNHAQGSASAGLAPVEASTMRLGEPTPLAE